MITMTDNPEVSGMLYKKRGGFGKMMPNAWQFRFFAITKDGHLLYFDTDAPEASVFDSKPRGSLNLKSVNFELLTDQMIEGAPTPFCIQVCPSNDERWKLCCDTKEDHAKWCRYLEKYISDKGQRVSSPAPMSYASDDELDKARINGLNKSKSTIMKVTSKDSELASSSRDSAPHALSSLKSAPPSTAVTPAKPNDTLVEEKTKPKTDEKKAEQSIQHADSKKVAGKKRLKLTTSGKSNDMFSQVSMEVVFVLLIVNICALGMATTQFFVRRIAYLAIANVVVAHSLNLRGQRTAKAASSAPAAAAAEAHSEKAEPSAKGQLEATQSEAKYGSSGAAAVAGASSVEEDRTAAAVALSTSGRPLPGFTFKEVKTDPKVSPAHTWCRVDHRIFNVRIGPDYNRHKKKAPSGPPIYEPFAVDVFCTKKRIDHASTRFELPDTSHINTNHPFVPPVFVIQIQIPSEPPPSLFTTVEDGPGWAIVMYFRITEDACNQLKDIKTASPAVKLFAEWCEKSTQDAAWRGRFKVICSCSNLEELGMPSAIVSYNAKPVLIRRTGTIFRGANYMEMNIHVHKFATLAKQSIYLISSRCGLMYMQIGFVIEGRDDAELPETLFACVAVNKPQEDEAEFIFEDE